MEPFVSCFCKTDAGFPVYGHVSWVDNQVDSRKIKEMPVKHQKVNRILTDHMPSCRLYTVELNHGRCQKPEGSYLKFTKRPPSYQLHTQCGVVTP